MKMIQSLDDGWCVAASGAGHRDDHPYGIRQGCLLSIQCNRNRDARIYLTAHQIGRINLLDDDQIAALKVRYQS